MHKDFIHRWGILPLWLLLTSTLLFRPPIPVDETRYLSVAWEMWLRGDFLAPFLNGQAYSHKPPLLFWLFQAGWGIFGVNEWWPRLVGPLCAFANLILVRGLAGKLWPQNPEAALLAPWVLIATLLWSLFATAAMFDILLACCVLLGMSGIVDLLQGFANRARIYIALAIGLGLLAKGPVILLHLLPTALYIGYYRQKTDLGNWYKSLGLAVLMGIGLALAWAAPAAYDGGSDYANAIFWRQTTQRTISGEIHIRPLLWYIQFLPLVLFPWFFWPRFWQSLRRTKWMADDGLRFCGVWLFSGLLFFSLIPSKQIHYLIPILPAFALIIARIMQNVPQTHAGKMELLLPAAFALAGLLLMLLPETPGLDSFKWAQSVKYGWGLSVLGVAAILAIITLLKRQLSVSIISTALILTVFAGFIFFFRYTGLAYDLRPAAQQLKALNEQGAPCAFVGNYQGQLHFLGRLTQPLPILTDDQAPLWAEQHSDGYLLSIEKEKPADAVYFQPHREYWLVFRHASQVNSINAL
ncbi:MAG: glycosyltransferase family 39 protein [Methylomonas sp.]|jgi:4-amino-4-deoxy-L-arabinose transferase-like glycosyltransferase